jgi:hypothetical protein
MPQAGVPAHARRRSATPWWEELDRDAFQFPTEYRVKPARRAVAVAERPLSAADRTAAVAERPVARAARPVAAAERPVARTSRPVAPGPRPVAAADRPVARAPRPVAAADRPVARAPRPVAAAPRAVALTPRVVEAAPQLARPSAPGRRTVTIRGRGAERNLPVARPTLRRHERPGFRPDRAALWAVMLGLLLILVAATSAHAAILH